MNTFQLLLSKFFKFTNEISQNTHWIGGSPAKYSGKNDPMSFRIGALYRLICFPVLQKIFVQLRSRKPTEKLTGTMMKIVPFAQRKKKNLKWKSKSTKQKFLIIIFCL